MYTVYPRMMEASKQLLAGRPYRCNFTRYQHLAYRQPTCHQSLPRLSQYHFHGVQHQANNLYPRLKEEVMIGSQPKPASYIPGCLLNSLLNTVAGPLTSLFHSHYCSSPSSSSPSTFPNYISGVHHFGWDFYVCDRFFFFNFFFNPTIEAVTFLFRGWCILGSVCYWHLPV